MKVDSEMYRKLLYKGGAMSGGLLLSLLFTLLFLAFFSFLMLKISLSAEIENIGLIIISVVSCFVGGFFCGKKNRSRAFLWGLIVGVLYYACIMLLRLLVGQEFADLSVRSITALFYCAASGMLGGMLS